MNKLVKRGLMAAAAAATVVGFAAGPAAAADQKVSLPYNRGYMYFTDDGDVFKVCDTYADGYGVTGQLRTLNSTGTGIVTVLTIDDGGDAYCDEKSYDIIGAKSYSMWVNWHGNSSWYESVVFSES
ncbi:hypothetical protein ACF1DV_05200 [Streptomyces achromogenes]|uniref:hypothetical protein n=1 Tax=Streptomyces achromogenes TaxID=67255 RepID=UPI0037008F33